MNIEVLADFQSVAQRAAGIIAEEASNAISARGRFVAAVSGGKKPWLMLRALANSGVPWAGIQIVQVDERVEPDGHTASQVPGDPVLSLQDVDVATTGAYRGRRRMTLTHPTINRSRRILWVVAGNEKTQMLNRLLDGDAEIPAGRVRREHALPLADETAAEETIAKSGKRV